MIALNADWAGPIGKCKIWTFEQLSQTCLGPQAVLACPLNPLYSHSAKQRMEMNWGNHHWNASLCATDSLMIIIIIIIIIIYCPKWKIFLPNWSWARQPLSSARSTLLYPFQMLNAKQGSSNSHLLTSFGMTRQGIEPTTSRLWGGRSTDWANTHRCL